MSISLPEHIGLVEQATLQIAEGMPIEAFVVDTTRGAKSTMYQGVAFWVNGRLVRTPSWIMGNTAVLDGRGRFAKRYSIVVQCGAEWTKEIEADWSRFKSTDAVAALNASVVEFAVTVFAKLSSSLKRANRRSAGRR